MFTFQTVFSVPLTAAQLALYMEKAITSIEAEFRNVATTSTVRLEELPPGVEAKNRYANVLPIPETRVHIRVQADNQTTDTPEQYINANYIKVFVLRRQRFRAIGFLMTNCYSLVFRVPKTSLVITLPVKGRWTKR